MSKKGDKMAAEFTSLTTKQKTVYSIIERYIKTRGIPPTVREIGELAGEKTPGAIQGILNRLEMKGIIKREEGMARSIQLISSDTLYAEPVYIPELKKITKRNIDNLFNVYNISAYRPFPPEMSEPDTQSFLVKCPDNSLAESGISYEDLLLINVNSSLKDGDIALVEIDGHIIIRRYFAHDENSIRLTADTDVLGKELYNKDEISLIGRLKGKFTSY